MWHHESEWQGQTAEAILSKRTGSPHLPLGSAALQMERNIKIYWGKSELPLSYNRETHMLLYFNQNQTLSGIKHLSLGSSQPHELKTQIQHKRFAEFFWPASPSPRGD